MSSNPQKQTVKGIVYSKFDIRIGPKPVIWLPSDLPREILVQTSRSMDITFGGQKNQESLAVVPLPDFSLKMLIKFMRYFDNSSRGGSVVTTLLILFDEKQDSVFYKYMRDFEAVFQEYGKKIIANEEKKADLKSTSQIILEFQDHITVLLGKLRAHEGDEEETTAFPKVADTDRSKEEMRFKLIIVGDPAVGKTSLISQFTDKAPQRSYIPTLGTNITEKVVEYQNFTAHFALWDIAGQSKFSRFRNHFYSGADGFLLVFDLTNPKTFDNVPGWYRDVRSLLPEIPGIIIANKHDMENNRQITDDAMAKISQELNCKIVITSAMTGENVETVFKELGQQLYDSKHKISSA